MASGMHREKSARLNGWRPSSRPMDHPAYALDPSTWWSPLTFSSSRAKILSLSVMNSLARRLLSPHSPSRLLRPSPRSMQGSMPQTRSAKAILSHQERTANEPRENDLHTATLAKVTPVNERIQRYRFDINDKNGFNV